ncbi:MAG: Zn-dependent hydrolase [Sphingomonas sp. 28-63-12]|nr:MAG: Zn-dependent hydrolase [Sphingomonas sp. 28-63-12]
MARIIGTTIFFAVIALCLALTIVPHFLDAIYYRGPVTAHFDGERFRNPDRDDSIRRMPRGKAGGYLWRRLTGQEADAAPGWPEHIAVTARPVAARVMGDAMVATWVGHATFLVQTQGLNILTDPIWSDRAGPFGIGPERVAPPGIAFDRLPKIDLVLVSHDHYDHMDLATLKRLWDRDRPLIISSLGNDAVIGQVGVPARTLDWGGRISVRPGIEVIVNRNHHWGSRWLSDKNRALWSSFVVRLPHGNLFFAGDTGAGDLKWADEAARYGPVRLALIPIGAFRFSPGQMGDWSHIGPVDAVEVARRLGASRSIGMHWGTFRLSSEGYDTPPRLLAAAMACTRQRGQFDAVEIGQPVRIASYTSPAGTTAMPRAALLACLDTPSVRAMR